MTFYRVNDHLTINLDCVTAIRKEDKRLVIRFIDGNQQSFMAEEVDIKKLMEEVRGNGKEDAHEAYERQR